MRQRNDRDCLICCLSKLLNVRYEDIPRFYEVYPANLNDIKISEEEAFMKAVDEWLDSKGYYRIIFDVEVINNDSIEIKVPYISLDRIRVLGILKKNYRLYSHCVILDIHKDEIEISDPKEDSDYDILDLIQIEILCRKGE